MLPDGTDRAWSRLTSRYQRAAGGRSSYDRFWGQMRRVSVSQVSGSAPKKVRATVRYTYASGRVARERRSFELVEDGGTLKIDRSSVISSG